MHRLPENLNEDFTTDHSHRLPAWYVERYGVPPKRDTDQDGIFLNFNEDHVHFASRGENHNINITVNYCALWRFFNEK